jgi:hypothetical protein
MGIAMEEMTSILAILLAMRSLTLVERLLDKKKSK